jgi:glucose-1-phosphate thymidylyltransferase
VWFDTGTFAGIQSASEFVRVIEEQLKIRIGDPSEVARLYGWI